VAVRPDSKRVAVASMDGQLSLWDIDLSKQVGAIDGRDDIVGGRFAADRFSAANSARSKHFTTLCYSADGNNVLAGGNSKYICLYDVNNEVLLKKFTISKNMSLDGTLDKLNSKNMTEAGPMDLIDTTGEASDLEDRIDNTLPGAQRGDASVRRVRPAIRTTCLRYSPTSRSFSASSSEGLLVYSVDDDILFDPFDLDLDVTVDSTVEKLAEKEYLVALVMAFRLGEQDLIHRVYESIPVRDIEIISKEIPQVYLLRLLRFIGSLSETSSHVEFNLLWIQALVTFHGRYIMNHRHEFVSALRQLQKSLRQVNKEFNKVASTNIYYLRFVLDGGEQTEKIDGDLDIQDGQHMSVDEDEEDGDGEDDDEGWFGPESRNDKFSTMEAGQESSDEDLD
jgi:periodic tryptophan protein 2